MQDLRSPDEIRELDLAMGVVKYSFFSDARDDDLSLYGAIVWHLAKVLALEYDGGSIRPDVLPSLSRYVIDRRTFFGPRFDPDRDALILPGAGTTESGVRLWNPTYDELGEQRIANWGQMGPEPPAYGYAFLQPIYPLQLSRAQAQDLFRRINRFFIPAEPTETIVQWSGPEIRDLCVHFEAGTETAYWGAYLYTIFDGATGYLTVISASTGP